MGIKEKVKDALRGLEKLETKIPGFKGYKEKELRRESDKLLRMQLAGKLDDQCARLSALQIELLSRAQIEYIDDMERAVMKLQLLIDRIKSAAYGYAGLFDAVKVKEEQLDALYEFDTAMFDQVDTIETGVSNVEAAIMAGEEVGLTIARLVVTVEQANITWGHRHETLLGSETLE